ncbi:EamA family transporter [Rhodococcus sp. BP-252]|uniref:EamA domain-containing protein n=1 Tax=Rhodococcoides kyotonense TaxID=398843 RepID=A0A177YJ01_9NOCA|nr:MULTISPECIES: EamA family transporter [Rhodococcus]NIL78178.1 putative inner membrane transporter YicL [Rhodococcus sp. B10]MBY6412116.1 EamA family transporter [Rhodococcus sp. BP-320]MBY6416696.1 EamA family transporter [Rhodococcus sp. BP-321]MBY6421115.1 EamA family transporter [Rhodococcus sp. BP-324]MBY6426720.1 EamA family transporter [Rhodococcus sp. BP-323]
MARLTPGVAGLSAVLAAAALFGTTGTAQALGSSSAGVDLDPLAVGSARIALAGLVLVPLAWLRGGFGATSSAGVRRVLIGGVGVAVYQVGFFSGVQMAGVAAGTMIALGSGPAFTGVLQSLVDRTRPGPVWFASTTLAVAGMMLLVTGSDPDDASHMVFGALAALSAGVGYAIYTVAGSRIIASGTRPDAAMAQMFAVGAVVLLPVLVLRWPGGLDSAPGLAVVLYLALIPTVVAYLLFGIGLSALPPATVATLTLAEPVVAALLGIVVLGESPTVLAGIGMAVVASALILLAVDVRRQSQRSTLSDN